MTARATSLLALIAVLGTPGGARADTHCDFVTRPSCSCDVQLAELAAKQDTDCQPSTAACQILLPYFFPCPKIPADNPISVEKIELGHLLFYDTRMSDNLTYSCATCHQQAKAFTDAATCHQQDMGSTDGCAYSVGSTGQPTPRGAMSLANVAYARTLTWPNPNLTTLEGQAIIPMTGENPVELGLTTSKKKDEMLARFRAEPRYQRMFAEAFPGNADPVTLDSVLKALGSFERTLISGNSPYDQSLFDDRAISNSALRGEDIVLGTSAKSQAANCNHCHNSFNLTASVDFQDIAIESLPPFMNTGLYNLQCSHFPPLSPLNLFLCRNPPSPEACTNLSDNNPGLACNCDGSGPQDMGCYRPDNTGKYSITSNPEDMGAFKPPTLRNIAVTGPYMHDGSIDTLPHVIDHYAAGGRTIPADDPLLGEYAGVGSKSPTKGSFMFGFTLSQLSDNDRADLVTFLESLTDRAFLTNPHFADPFQPVACPGDCNLDGRVEVSEVITVVNISLGKSSLASCVSGDPSGDGAVTIDELLRAVDRALNGCS